MKELVFNNNFKLIYKQCDSKLTSICISLNAGAGRESEKLGIAHAVEHMVYKGTKKRSELEINKDLSDIFGFQNAMTNYPYVIYYGSLLGEDFERGIELFSDIILNPVFDESGFKEEMSVIKHELQEWDEELEQYCEDRLFLNFFNNRRIKYPIIGTHKSLDSITLDDIRNFYEENYFPGNASITVISDLEFEKVKEVVEKYFGAWEGGNCRSITEIEYETPINKVIYEEKEGIKTSKVEIIYPIDSLNEEEKEALLLFNQYFGEGVNSILYDRLRTKCGLIYDVITKIAYENYIKLYKITFTTSKYEVEKTLDIIKDCIKELDLLEKDINEPDMIKLTKSLKLKRLFREQQSIILAKELSTYDTMFGDYKLYLKEIEGLEKITKQDMFEVGRKVLQNASVQVIY